MNRDFLEVIKIPETVRIPYFGGKWFKFMNYLANKIIRKEVLPEQPLNTEPREEKVIATLTTYPARIGCVHLAIKSIMLQTYKPDRIILWLADSQFPGRVLPEELRELEKYGLEILWMHDLHSNKKFFYPVLNQKEDELVITFDDDIIFSSDVIENLIKKHKEYPDCMVCTRAQAYDKTNPYQPGRWITISDVGVNEPSYSLNPSPGGGCLIPYGLFCEDVCNEEKINTLAHHHDDVWFMFMCVQNNRKIIKTRKYHKTFSEVANSQVEAIAHDNILNNSNLGVVKKLSEVYPDAWHRIVTDTDVK